MAATTNTTGQNAVKAAVDAATAATKVATELKSRLDRAVKAASADDLTATAACLVDLRWVGETDVAKVASALADPTTALTALREVATKAAEAISKQTQTANPRLEAGRLLPSTKQSSATATEPVSPADVAWAEKMAARRKQLN